MALSSSAGSVFVLSGPGSYRYHYNSVPALLQDWMRVQVHGAVLGKSLLSGYEILLVMVATKSPQARVEPTQTIDLTNQSEYKIPGEFAKNLKSLSHRI